jgi:hypothetical protein
MIERIDNAVILLNLQTFDHINFRHNLYSIDFTLNFIARFKSLCQYTHQDIDANIYSLFCLF